MALTDRCVLLGLLIVVWAAVLQGCAPAEPAAAEASPECSTWSYRRPSVECVDLQRCRWEGSTWVQTRRVSRSIPAVRFPSAGCDPQDLGCVGAAEVAAVSWACRP